MKKVQLENVNWKQSYPREIEGEDLLLKQRTWGRRLIYEVFWRETDESLGTCQVFQKKNCKDAGTCQRFVVREQVGTKRLIAKLDKIQDLVCISLSCSK